MGPTSDIKPCRPTGAPDTLASEAALGPYQAMALAEVTVGPCGSCLVGLKKKILCFISAPTLNSWLCTMDSNPIVGPLDLRSSLTLP